jgi:glucose/arabinose dehydrogenase
MKTILHVLLVTCLYFVQYSQAQTLPADFSRVLIDDGLSSPTAFAFLPDGRILVTQQEGALRVIKSGSLLTTSAITLSVTSAGERGLIGIAVDPEFTTNQYVYLYYTVPANTERTAAFNKIVRFTFDGDVIDESSAQPVLELNDLSSAHTNHNGGSMNFGPDGKLYIGVGENATGANAQDLDNYLGKILRINSDGSVPTGNPFAGNDAKSRIWAYGLRNPYSFTFDRLSGKLFVNDVGESTWEEINDATTGGLNFGWPSKEGFCSNSCTGFTDPVYAYEHATNTDGKGCSIVGGTFFNPVSTNYPAVYQGQYFFNDYCGKWINSINLSNPSQRNAFGTDLGGAPVYLLTGPDGNLYYTSRDDHALYKIIYTGITGITDPVKENLVSITPNPSSGKVKINVVSKENDFLTVGLRNAQGENLFVNQQIPAGSEMDLSAYPNGFYFIQIDGYTTKWIKE